MTGVPLGPGGWFYEQGHRICVNGLGTKATKTILQAAFGEFGHIIKIETPRSGTAAYISFQDRLDADDAIKSMDGERIDGQRVTVSRAGDRPPPGAGLKEGSVVDRHREVLTTTNFEREEKRTAQYLDSKGWDKRLGSKQHKSVPSQSRSRSRSRCRGCRPSQKRDRGKSVRGRSPTRDKSRSRPGYRRR